MGPAPKPWGTANTVVGCVGVCRAGCLSLRSQTTAQAIRASDTSDAATFHHPIPRPTHSSIHLDKPDPTRLTGNKLLTHVQAGCHGSTAQCF